MGLVMNHEFLGDIQVGKGTKKGLSPALFYFGYMMGLALFTCLIAIKSMLVLFLWNTFLAVSVGLIDFAQSFAIVAILNICCSSYKDNSYLKNVFDLLSKVALFSFVGYVLTFL